MFAILPEINERDRARDHHKNDGNHSAPGKGLLLVLIILFDAGVLKRAPLHCNFLARIKLVEQLIVGLLALRRLAAHHAPDDVGSLGCHIGREGLQ